MVPWLTWAARAAAAIVVGGVGLVMLIAAVSADNRSSWTIGVSAAIFIAGILAWPKRPNAWRRDPPTERQLAYARDLGIAVPDGISKGDLSDLISQAAGRERTRFPA